MAWVKLDDALPEHEKLERAGDKAGWMFVCGLCYCNRNRTDGLIPRGRVSKLTGFTRPMKLAEALVDADLWEREGPDFRVHDYHDYQPSRTDLEATDHELREKRAAAGRKGAASRWDGKPNGKTNGKRMAKPRQTGRQTDGPVPVSRSSSFAKAQEAGVRAVESLPEELQPLPAAVRDVLLRVAAGKPGAKEPSLAAVAKAIGDRPRKDFLPAVANFEHYWLFGKAEDKPLKDVVAAYRNWLNNEPDVLRRTPTARKTGAVDDSEARLEASRR